MTEPKDNKAVKLPFISTILGPFALVFSGGMRAFILCMIFAGIVTFITGITGNLSTCISENFRIKYSCNESGIVFIITKILIFAVDVIFIRNWIGMILEDKKSNWREIFTPNLRDGKIAGVLLLLFASIGVALLALYLLYARQPNPNWRIELIYFGVVSLGFLVPILALRFLGYIASAALGEKMLSPLTIWQKTSGNMFLLLSGAFAMIMVMTIIMLNLLQFAGGAALTSNLASAWLCEFVCSLGKTITIIMFANFCYLLNKNLS